MPLFKDATAGASSGGLMKNLYSPNYFYSRDKLTA
jgi:hypothetical protein